MATKKKPPARVDPRWTQWQLDSVVDYLMGHPGPHRGPHLVHIVETGHGFEWAGHRSKPCATCGEHWSDDLGAGLIATLFAILKVSDEDSAFRGLTFHHFVEVSTDVWTVEFDERLAASWVKTRARQLSNARTSDSDAYDGAARLRMLEEQRIYEVPATMVWPNEKVEFMRRRAAALDEEIAAGGGVSMHTVGVSLLARKAILSQQVMRVVGGSESRKVLTDATGAAWIAVPVDSVQVDGLSD